MKACLTSLFIGLFATLSFGQQSLVESAKKAADFYHEGDFEQSIAFYDSVNSWPHLYYLSVLTIVNKAHEGDSQAIAFIDYYSKSNLFSARNLEPVDAYLKIRSITDEEELLAQKNLFMGDLRIKPDSSHMEQLYNLAIYYYLSDNNAMSIEERKEIVRLLLRRNLFTATKNFDAGIALKKYLNVALLAEEVELGEEEASSVLDEAMTPEEISDLKFFWLIENKELGFMPPFEIKKTLVLDMMKDGKPDEVLRHAVHIVAEVPTEENIKWVQSLFDGDEQFRIFWTENVHTQWPKFKSSDRIKQYIDSLTTDGMWIVLDVWGTWCSPCIKEMPEMAKMGKAFDRLESQPIKFLTLSYESKDLENFMTENKYDFHYLEVTKEEMKEMNIHSYPTTILIAENGKYVRLPFGEDKQEMIRTYTMLVW